MSDAMPAPRSAADQRHHLVPRLVGSADRDTHSRRHHRDRRHGSRAAAAIPPAPALPRSGVPVPGCRCCSDRPDRRRCCRRAMGVALLGAGPAAVTSSAVVATGGDSSAGRRQHCRRGGDRQPSVVNIDAGGRQRHRFVIRSDGYILTQQPRRRRWRQTDGDVRRRQHRSGRLVGADSGYDLAGDQGRSSRTSGRDPGHQRGRQVSVTAITIGSPLGLYGNGHLRHHQRASTDPDRRRRDPAVGRPSSTPSRRTPRSARARSGAARRRRNGRVIGVNSAIASLGGSATGGQSGSHRARVLDPDRHRAAHRQRADRHGFVPDPRRRCDGRTRSTRDRGQDRRCDRRWSGWRGRSAVGRHHHSSGRQAGDRQHRARGRSPRPGGVGDEVTLTGGAAVATPRTSP